MDDEMLAQQFEQNRAHLRTVAYRMLGSMTEADDAVQESWLRLHRSGPGDIHNLGGWLTTVVARVCLDMLRSRRTRREDPLDDHLTGSLVERAAQADPEREALLGDAVGPALLVVLETLAPAERLSFVLHDMFAVPYEEIAPIVGRSPEAARQLASRARRRVQGVDVAPDAQRQRAVVDAFLTASRTGDFAALLALLDPDVVLRADSTAVSSGAEAEVRGAQAVATTFSGRARSARPASIDGSAGAVWAPGGQPRVVFGFAVLDDRIIGIELLADPDRLEQLDLVVEDRAPGPGVSRAARR